MPGEGAAIVDDLRIVAEGRAHGFRDVFPRHTDAERLGCLDGGDGVLGKAGQGAQPVGPGGEDAEDVEQSGCQRTRVGARAAPGQQELQQFAVVDSLGAGAQEPGLEPVAAGGVAERCRRFGDIEERHVLIGVENWV